MGDGRRKSDGAEDADGEEEDGFDDVEDSGNGDADEAEWKREEPHDGIEDKCDKG